MIPMKRGPAVICIAFLAVVHLSAADRPTLTRGEALKLVHAADPELKEGTPGGPKGRISGLIIDFDHEHDGCAVYRAYFENSERTFTIGWWSVDVRTAEVWDDVKSERITSQRVASIQQAIRRRLGVTEEERSRSISKPCRDRNSQ
jgi:hypothetical protein